MENDIRIKKYRRLYSRLVSLYPAPHRKRFGRSMEQTFSDLLRERSNEQKGLLGYAVWLFVDTSIGIIDENLKRGKIMQDVSRRLIGWAVAIALLLMIPLVAMQFTDEVNWSLFDFVIMGGALFGIGLVYELIARRSSKTIYRIAFGVGLAGAFLLFWVNGAVGIIGSENQDANLLYGAVFVVGLIGSVISRFQPRGMSNTLFAAAAVQMSVPIVALIIWPPPATSWSPSVFGVFTISALFAVMFIVSALLFRQSGSDVPPIVQTHTR